MHCYIHVSPSEKFQNCFTYCLYLGNFFHNTSVTLSFILEFIFDETARTNTLTSLRDMILLHKTLLDELEN